MSDSLDLAGIRWKCWFVKKKKKRKELKKNVNLSSIFRCHSAWSWQRGITNMVRVCILRKAAIFDIHSQHSIFFSPFPFYHHIYSSPQSCPSWRFYGACGPCCLTGHYKLPRQQALSGMPAQVEDCIYRWFEEEISQGWTWLWRFDEDVKKGGTKKENVCTKTFYMFWKCGVCRRNIYFLKIWKRRWKQYNVDAQTKKMLFWIWNDCLFSLGAKKKRSARVRWNESLSAWGVGKKEMKSSFGGFHQKQCRKRKLVMKK